MKKRRQSSDYTVLSRCKNRPYLASCPVEIVHAVFLSSHKTQKNVMRLCVYNGGDRVVTDLSILLRYFDRDGHPIGDASVYLCRGGNYEAHKASYGSRSIPLPYLDIAGVDARVIALSYADGSSEEFSADAYELTPPQKLLDDTLPDREAAMLRQHFGEKCFFVPVVGEEPQWLCACGAVAEGDRCSACSLTRRHAWYLSEKGRRNAYLRFLKGRRIALRILPYAAGAVLIGVGIWFLYGKYRQLVDEVLPEERLRVTEKYIEEERYNEALAYSSLKNDSILYDTILDEAVAHYCAAGDFEEAIRYENCRAEPDYEPIYRAAAEAYIAGTSENAARALQSADAELTENVLRRMAEKELAAGRLSEACAVALHLQSEDGAAYSDELFRELIGQYLSRADYVQAVACISRLHDPSCVEDLFYGVESELLRNSKYDEAFAVAELTGDLSVYETVYPRATSTILRLYYDKFSRLMSAAAKRSFLACRLAASDNLIAAIGDDGTARDTVRGVLTENAVSVACGDNHVLVLLSDGTVRAYGDNGAGQCGANGLTHVAAVSAAGNHSLVLFENGTVRAYGDNGAGQGNVNGWSGVIAIAAGKEHSVALRSNGTVLACGANGCGQCGVTQYTNVIAVAAGEYSTALVFRDGSVLAEGNLTVETLETRKWNDVVRVCVGNAYLIGLTSGGRVLSAGLSVCGSELNTSSWSRIRTIACGGRVSYALASDGQILFCGEVVPQSSREGWDPFA